MWFQNAYMFNIFPSIPHLIQRSLKKIVITFQKKVKCMSGHLLLWSIAVYVNGESTYLEKKEKIHQILFQNTILAYTEKLIFYRIRY